jgi:hypothetical protein
LKRMLRKARRNAARTLRAAAPQTQQRPINAK